MVAGRPLRYGNELSAQALREIVWPQAELPDGAFAKINDVLKDGKRIVLTAIEPNEPVLSVKITGAGQRATLSSLVQPGMKAVTIRVNDVDGVGGFVLPGDHVDVALTSQVDKDNASTQVVLQGRERGHDEGLQHRVAGAPESEHREHEARTTSDAAWNWTRHSSERTNLEPVVVLVGAVGFSAVTR